MRMFVRLSVSFSVCSDELVSQKLKFHFVESLTYVNMFLVARITGKSM